MNKNSTLERFLKIIGIKKVNCVFAFKICISGHSKEQELKITARFSFSFWITFLYALHSSCKVIGTLIIQKQILAFSFFLGNRPIKAFYFIVENSDAYRSNLTVSPDNHWAKKFSLKLLGRFLKRKMIPSCDHETSYLITYPFVIHFYLSIIIVN